MELNTLSRANELQKRIYEYEAALEIFETKVGDEVVYDRTPMILLNVDDLDGGRENIPIPMILSNGLVEFLRVEIQVALEESKIEFENL